MHDHRTLTARAQAALHPPHQRLWLVLLVACTLGLLAVLAGSQVTRAQDQPPVIVHKIVSHDVATIGETVTYSITILNAHTGALDLGMEDPLAADLSLVADSLQSSTGQAQYSDATHTITWGGALKPDETAVIRFRATLIDVPGVALKCSGEIINKVTIKAEQLPTLDASAQVALKRVCPDLGDAPDSTNHPAAGMTAYPGPIVARYPTVFDAATGTPPGPRHWLTKADAWLGKDVSGERDADLLPDEDGPPTSIPQVTSPMRPLRRRPAQAAAKSTS
ncbi:MAG: hypothetical protein R2873_11315 [Caldilineaceae bacterium]